MNREESPPGYPRSTNSGSLWDNNKPKQANEFGLYDMSGNIGEWIWDWYDTYPAGTISSDIIAGKGIVMGTFRVVRGGPVPERVQRMKG